MKKSRGFVLVTVLLIAITVFSVTGTVKSQSREGIKIDTEHYKQMEREYVREIKSYLSEQGFENSGVMLTYVSYGSSTRQYTVTVHNEKISGLSESEKAALKNEILELAFEAPGCTFFGEFLSI